MAFANAYFCPRDQTSNMTTNTDPKPQSGTSDWKEFGKHRSRLLHRESVAENVDLYITEKPPGFTFRPGQAVDLAIDQEGWRDEKRPFTITSLPDNPRLEFIIKSYPTASYPDHDGMTEHLGRDIVVGDRLIFGDPWGTIEYRGPGVFIAGGAGITPFIAIFRQLEQEKRLDGNRLFFSNCSAKDVFLQGELFRCFGNDVVCTLTKETKRDFEEGRINKDWLQSRIKDFNQPFYVCGPPAMVEDLGDVLKSLGVKPDAIVFESSD